MSRIFGMNNHNTNVHNTNCTHFQMEKGQMVKSESREPSRSSIIIDRVQREYTEVSPTKHYADKLFDQ